MNDPRQTGSADLPEYALGGRYKLAFKWLPKRLKTLLDAGCAWGYGTRFFREKCTRVFGLDCDKTYVEVARSRYPDIVFVESELEATPFESQFFDAILCCDSLEHVRNEIACLNEMFRLLKTGGMLVITVPHKGIFGFMDPANSAPWIGYLVKRYLPSLFRVVYRIRKGEDPKAITYVKPIYSHDTEHRHYSLAGILQLLDESDFRDRYEIVRIFRSGLLIGVITLNLEFYLGFFLNANLKRMLLRAFTILSEIDFWIPYHILAYNIAVMILKKSDEDIASSM